MYSTCLVFIYVTSIVDRKWYLECIFLFVLYIVNISPVGDNINTKIFQCVYSDISPLIS